MIQRLFPLLLALAMAACALPASAADDLVEGRNYVRIADGKPLVAEPGRIEVVEVFAYWCHHCNNFAPLVAAWKRKQPDDVAFRHLPAAFTLDDRYARAYFASESLGTLARTHAATFRAIHAEHALPPRGASLQELATLYAQHGVEPAGFVAAMRSPATDARMEASRAFIVAAEVQGTPTIIVNGRYRVIGKTFGDMLRTTDLLVARERAAASVQ